MGPIPIELYNANNAGHHVFWANGFVTGDQIRIVNSPSAFIVGGIIGWVGGISFPYTFAVDVPDDGIHGFQGQIAGDYSQGAPEIYCGSAAKNFQSISFPQPANKRMGTGDATLSATASSGLTVSYQSNSTGICTVNGSNVTLVATGTCSITASQAGDGSTNPAPNVTQTFTVLEAIPNPPTLQSYFRSSPPLPYNAGSASSTQLFAAFLMLRNESTAVSNYYLGSSGTATSGSTSAGGSVSITTDGVAFYTAPVGYRGGDSFQVRAHNAGGDSSTETFSLVVGNPTLNISLNGGSGTALQPLSGVSIQTTGGKASYSCAISSGALPAGVSLITNDCTLTGTPQAAGNFNFKVSVTDSSTGTGPFTQESGTLTLAVDSVAQSITFTQPADVTYAPSGTVNMVAMGGASGNPVTFASTTPAVCTTDSGGSATVTIVKAGQCSITASQAGSASYSAAGPVSKSFAINQATQTISFTSTPPNPALIGRTYGISASGGASGNAVTFAIDASSAGSCTLVGSTVTFAAEGTCKINADQLGDDNYAAAAQMQQTFAVSKEATVLVLGASSATPQLGQPVTFTATITPPDVTGPAAFSDPTVVGPLCPTSTFTAGVTTCTHTFTSVGTQTITVTFGGDARHASSQQQVTITVQDSVGPATQAIGGFISDRSNQIVSNLFDMSRNIDRLNDAQGQGGGSSGNFADDGRSDLPAGGFGFGGKPMAGGSGMIVAPSAALASQGANGMADLWGLQAMLYNAMQNAGESGSMDRFNYTGAFDASVNAHDGLSASFHTSLSQLAKWQQKQDAALGIGSSRAGYSSPLDVWMEGTYAGYDGERSGQFGLFSVGSDYVVNPNLLIGVFTQVDTMNQTSSTHMSGTGWMAGPYATVRLSDQLFWQSRAAWGRSGNSLSGSGDFTSTRWLASSELDGRWNLSEHLVLAPGLSFTYFQDYTDAYKDTFGVTIPGVKTELGQLKFSPALTYGFATDGGLWVEPSLTPELIWNFASTNVDGLGALSDTATGPTGLRGRVKAGLTFRTEQGVAISATGSYDGIGSTGYSAIAAQARVNVPLN
ncbi:autotransporter domain-containing protein [Aestuariivirga litoralis]|uniref:autotransporter domain-containing protein n=1 Tax=Aestuariivirga litoralis TaxID=2650924 RepID=UPI0018C5BDA0|nr:Ig-like domain repeat protein [Aestuariivirga litoralis]